MAGAFYGSFVGQQTGKLRVFQHAVDGPRLSVDKHGVAYQPNAVAVIGVSGAMHRAERLDGGT